jgi:NhaP-type Na+/H+ or K+/H+ antiporter
VIWAAAAGLGVGWLLGRLTGGFTLYLRRTHSHAVGYEDFLVLGLIALSYGIALLIHAYGFLAVFAAGLALRHLEMKETGSHKEPDAVIADATSESPEEEIATHRDAAPAYMAHALLGFSEQLERILEVSVVVVVGSLLAWADWSPLNIAFVCLLLFAVRPLAVYATLHGSSLKRNRRPYVAWFGIRGIGSLYYLAFALTHGLAGSDARQILATSLSVVAISAVLHGITVTPLMRRYSQSEQLPRSATIAG